MVFTRLHRLHFCIAAHFAPFLERLHIIIKLTRNRDQLIFQQIVISIRALLIQGRNHWRDPFRIVNGQTCRDLIQQLLSLWVVNAALDHRLQRFLRLRHFFINALHRFGGVIQHADFHQSDSLTGFVTGA
ncbi:hypothetical protein D3C78_1370680 [compost metagenome]